MNHTAHILMNMAGEGRLNCQAAGCSGIVIAVPPREGSLDLPSDPGPSPPASPSAAAGHPAAKGDPMTYYKLARPDGWDFYTGKTINYREAIGGIVSAPDWRRIAACGHGLHICANPNDCFVGAKIPCAAFEVEPAGRVKPVAIDTTKVKVKALRVIREVTDLDGLFGWRYSEAINPLNPFSLPRPLITEEVEKLLGAWASVRASAGASVWDSVAASVWDSVRDTVWASVRDSLWDSVWDSVADSVWAYIGSLFPGITTWKYVEYTPGEYPFASAAGLWRMGLVPSYDGKLWHLHAGPDGRIVWPI